MNMDLKDDFVSVRIADLLKENGFNEWCGTVYVNGHFNYGTPIRNEFWTKNVVTAPTMSFAMKWLREKHNVFISIIRHNNKFCVTVCDADGNSYSDKYNSLCYDSYYEAAENTLFDILVDMHIWVKDSETKSETDRPVRQEDILFAKHLEECYDNNPLAYLVAMEMAAHIRNEIEQKTE